MNLADALREYLERLTKEFDAAITDPTEET